MIKLFNDSIILNSFVAFVAVHELSTFNLLNFIWPKIRADIAVSTLWAWQMSTFR